MVSLIQQLVKVKTSWTLSSRGRPVCSIDPNHIPQGPGSNHLNKSHKSSGSPLEVKVAFSLTLCVKETSVQFSSVAQSCLTLFDPMNCSTPDLPVHHQLPEFTQTHVHRVGDAIQPSHPLSSPSPPAPLTQCKKAKRLSEEALQIAEKRKDIKCKGEKERYIHPKAEFQRIQGEIRKPSSVINAKKQRKIIEWVKLVIASRKL